MGRGGEESLLREPGYEARLHSICRRETEKKVHENERKKKAIRTNTWCVNMGEYLTFRSTAVGSDWP